MPQRVAVIGAGPSGLCTLRQFAEHPDEFALTAYDKNRDVGGLWNYTDETKIDEYGLPSLASMYKSLRINLPTVLMAYPGYPFNPDLPSFCESADVLKYLCDFADHFDIRKFVKFQTHVIEVKPETRGDAPVIWHVKSCDLVTNRVSTAQFDVVVVCNGTEGEARMPDIPGGDTFKGELIHSKHFRDPQAYKGKVVMVLGSSYSAGDIVFEVAHLTNRKFYISHRRKEPLKYKLPMNVEEVSCIKEVVSDGVYLQDGRHVAVDVIIYATGYHYKFPFLTPECGITLKGDRIQPMYRHMFNINHPTLCFVGMIKQVLEYQIAHKQALYLVAQLRGVFNLPSKEQMLADEEEDYQRRIVAEKRTDFMTHDLFGQPQWEYIAKISKEGKFPSITPGSIKLFDYTCILYDEEFDNFKNREFRLIDDEPYEKITLCD